MSAVTPISQQRDIQQAEVRTFRQRVSAVFGSYTFRVIMQGLLTIWAVVTFTFFLIRLLPGNPIDIKIDQLMQQRNITYEEALSQAAALYHFDANAPLFQQYLTYLGQLVQGDLGESITSAGTQVSAQILRYLPWTLFSLGLALLISFTVGVLIGLAMAYWRGGILDNVMTVLASILYGIPDYVIALFLIIVARPAAVFISLIFLRIPWRQMLFVAWVGLRGAAPIILATFPLLARVEQADLFFNIVFFVVLTSVLLQGTSIPQVARWLKLDLPVVPKRVYPIEFTSVGGFKSELKELPVPTGSCAIGKAIFELGLPEDFLVVLIARESDFLVPSGGVVVQGGDVFLVLSTKESFDAVQMKVSQPA